MYTEKVKYRRNYLLLLLFLIFLSGSILAFSLGNNLENIAVGIVSLVLVARVTIPLLRNFIGYIVIKVESQKLLIQRFLFVAGKLETFELEKIKRIKCKRNEDSNSYYSFATFSGGGFIYTPESSKTYIKNPVTIHFDYEKKHILIGEGFEEFNGDKIVKLVKQNRKN